MTTDLPSCTPVIDFVERSQARRALRALLGLLGQYPWLLRAVVETQGEAVYLDVLVIEARPSVRMCIPHTCDGFPVQVAGTGPCRSRIPEQADHRFRSKPITDSGASRSLNA